MRKTKICGFLSRDMLRAAGSIAILGVTASAFAQVSGTWTNLGATPSFSDPNNWSSFPQAPGDGGEVVFNGPYRSQTSIVLPNDLKISRWTIAGSLGIRTSFGGFGSVTLVGPAEILTDNGSVNSPASNGFVDGILSPIHGTAGLTKLGSGHFMLNAGNTYTGGTRVLGGWVVPMAPSALGDSSGSVTLDGGGLFAWGASDDYIAREFAIGAGGGTIITPNIARYGNITGSGRLVFEPGAASQSVSSGPQIVAPFSHSGEISVIGQTLNLVYSPDGSTYGRLPAISRIEVNHRLVISGGSFGTPIDAINDAATISMRGGVTGFGNTGGAPEAIGPLSLQFGGNTTGGTFTAASLQRSAGATWRIGPARPGFQAAPPMIGNGPAGTSTVGVMPYAVVSSASQPHVLPVTFDGGQVRTLTASEQITAAMLASGNSPDVNIRAGNHTFLSPVSVRSLQVEQQGVNGATVTINGGGVYITTPFSAIAAPLDFGVSEGIVHALATVSPTQITVLPADIHGSAGLTLNGTIAVTGASTYTGPTFANGRIEVRGNVLEGVPSPFGMDASAIVIRADSTAPGSLRFAGTQALLFERDLKFETAGRAPATLNGGTVAGTITGNLELSGALSLTSESPNNTLRVEGIVSGTGVLRIDRRVFLSGANTYTGGTVLNGTLSIASDSALGTGPIWHELTTGSINQRVIEAIGGTRVLGNELRLNDSTHVLGFRGVHPLTLSKTVIAYTDGFIDVGPSTTVSFSGGFSNHSLIATGTGTLQLAWYRGRGIDVRGGRVAFLPGENQTSSRAESIAIQTGTALDLNDHTLILDFGGGTITGGEAGLRGLLSDGRLISSVAQANPGTAIGYALAGDVLAVVGGGAPVLYADQLVRAEDLLVRYTLAGDADLNGVVNISDFSRLAANFNLTNAVWSRGDFNYDGVTGIGDFAVLASNFNETLPRGLPRVPEANSLFVLAIAAALKCHRRRR